jgi:predicted phosphodiesterase
MEIDNSEKDVDDESKPPSGIGIMADSHGHPDKIVAALEYFSKQGCSCLYHLGDICDSGHPETAEACVRPLQHFNVMAIKGNNDHQIDVNHRGRMQSLIPQDVLGFIQKLPLVRQFQHAVFTHSLPFVRELGLSSMIGVMGDAEIKRILRAYPKGILFRGHSHTPEIFAEQEEKIISRTLRIGQRFDLTYERPCIVTCGALTRKLCMIWMPRDNIVECHQF